MNKIISKGFISILDQGIFAGTNFLLSILLGRWLTQDAYGAYSLAMVVFLLAAGQYVSFILEPMSVLGPSEQKENISGYFYFLLKSHIGITIILAFIILGISFFFINLNNAAIRTMALFLPCILSIWFVRWFLFMQGYPQKSLVISITYLILLISGLGFLNHFGYISEGNAFLVIGLASFIPSFVVILKNILNTKKFQVSTANLYKTHWNYGKWIGLASILNWSAIQIFTIFVVVMIDLESAGGLKSIQNIAQPLEQTSTALGLLLIPIASRLYVENSVKKYSLIINSVNWLLVGIGILYLIIILIFREPIFQFAYGGNYIKYIDMIPFVVLVPIIFSMSRGAQIGIRAKRQPKKLLIAYLIAAIATFIIGPLLIYRFGFNGAIAGMVFTAIIFSTSTNILYFYKLRGNKDEKEVSKKILY